jgi:hypothetical protein
MRGLLNPSTVFPEKFRREALIGLPSVPNSANFTLKNQPKPPQITL